MSVMLLCAPISDKNPGTVVISSTHEAPALRRGMVDVIAKLQEAARKAAENAERLEKGEGAAEEEDEEADEEAVAEAEAEADEDADVEAEPADAPAEQANGTSAQQPAGACLVLPTLLLQQGSIPCVSGYQKATHVMVPPNLSSKYAHAHMSCGREHAA